MYLQPFADVRPGAPTSRHGSGPALNPACQRLPGGPGEGLGPIWSVLREAGSHRQTEGTGASSERGRKQAARGGLGEEGVC